MHTYKNSGVDKAEGYKAVEKIKSKAAETHNDRVLSGLGGFASLYALKKYRNPVLVSGTDGVGTKLTIALAKKSYNTIGQDCFAMCANDIICQGARPLFFLDYLACGKLDSDVSSEIISGMVEACKEADCALVGGETAEMPGFYKDGDYDMAGFCVGVVERDKLVSGNDVREGDVILGLSSSGVHSNGFSLVRSLLRDFDEDFQGVPVCKELLKPTRVYVNSVLKTLDMFPGLITGLAHITGGGLPENLPRTIPDGLCGEVHKNSISILPIFKWLQAKGVSEEEMWNTFNMGIGFIVIVRPDYRDAIISQIESLGETVSPLGKITRNSKKICLR